MSHVQATVVADSVAPSGVRLTTMLLTYATMVHQDILTHRTIYKMKVGEWAEIDSSKSTNSNRAKPTKTVLQEVWKTPFCPVRFPRRSVTMHSSRGYLSGWRHHVARHLWLKARYVALLIALLLMWTGVHKQIANRLLMPWTYTTLVMTAVDEWWQHFFTLRNHYAAQDEVQDVASKAHLAYIASRPRKLAKGEWHVPFVSIYELVESDMVKLSVARCARTSYASSYNHIDMIHSAMTRPQLEDFGLFHRLMVQDPAHDGPREHQAQAHDDPNYRSGNLHGWEQLRHSWLGEYLRKEAMQSVS